MKEHLRSQMQMRPRSKGRGSELDSGSDEDISGIDVEDRSIQLRGVRHCFGLRAPPRRQRIVPLYRL